MQHRPTSLCFALWRNLSEGRNTKFTETTIIKKLLGRKRASDVDIIYPHFGQVFG